MDENFTKYSLIDRFNVSRETCRDFERFIALIIKKNKKINLISKKTEPIYILRERHIIDSAQANAEYSPSEWPAKKFAAFISKDVSFFITLKIE